MSGKEKLKFNWLIKFSSWSGNWATLFTQKKKRNVSTFWPDTHCPPMCHRFPYIRFDMAPTFYLLREIGFHRYNRIFLMSPSLLSARVRTLSMHPNSFCFLIIQIFGKSNILSVPWWSALKRQRANVAMYFINNSLSSNKTKKPLHWNNLMLRLLLVDTLPILFRCLPKCLEISLVIVRKQKKTNKNSWKYYLRTCLLIKLLSLLVVYAA